MASGVCPAGKHLTKRGDEPMKRLFPFKLTCSQFVILLFHSGLDLRLELPQA